MSKLAIPAYQHEIARAAESIRDYYNLKPHEAHLGKHMEAFNRAKEEYVRTITRQLLIAESITFERVFPKVAMTKPNIDDSLPFMGE